MLEKIRIGWDRTVEPFPNVTDTEHRRKSRLMAGINLISALLVMALLPLAYFFSGSYLLIVISVTAQLFSAFLVLATYWLARSGRLFTASMINVFLASGVILGATFLQYSLPAANVSSPDHSLYFLVVVIVYACIFLPTRATVTILVVLLAATLVLPAVEPRISLSQVLIGPFNFILFNGVFLIFVFRHYRSVEQERLQQITNSEIRYRLLFENSRDVIYLISPEGMVLAINPLIELLTGWRPDEIIGKYFTQIIHPEDCGIAVERLTSRFQGKPGKFFELRLLTRDGGVIPMECAPAAVLEYTNLSGVLGSMRDIRERKQADEQRMKAILEREQVQLVNSFVTAVSHDFRTSLSNIENNRYLISRSLNADVQGTLEPRLNIIRTSVDHMRNQLINLDTVNSLVHLPINPQMLNLLLEQVVAAHRPHAEERGLTLHFTPDERIDKVPVNAPKLHLAVQHLVQNAIAHTQENGHVEVMTRLNGEFVEIIVKDSGIGIAPDQQESVFELFYRGDDARSVRTGGVGIGLSIVRMVVRAHGGHITLESALGKGTTFTIVLPLSGIVTQ